MEKKFYLHDHNILITLSKINNSQRLSIFHCIIKLPQGPQNCLLDIDEWSTTENPEVNPHIFG